MKNSWKLVLMMIMIFFSFSTLFSISNAQSFSLGRKLIDDPPRYVSQLPPTYKPVPQLPPTYKPVSQLLARVSILVST